MMSLIRLFVSALNTSRRLDDRARDVSTRSAVDPGLLGEQERIDAALSDARNVPWQPPSPTVREAVLRGIRNRRYEESARPRQVAGGLYVAVAAVIVMAALVMSPAGDAASRYLEASFTRMMSADALAVKNGGGPAQPPQGASAAISADALRGEIDAVREDTDRAARAVLPGSQQRSTGE
jgi:hypothetical protein